MHSGIFLIVAIIIIPIIISTITIIGINITTAETRGLTLCRTLF